MKAVLVKSTDRGENITLPLTADRISVGRVNVDLCLAHASVSRDHALLQRRPEGWVLSDLDSRNGTRVNGVTVARRLLQDGDIVRFGSLDYIFRELEDEIPVLPLDVADPEAACDACDGVTGYMPEAASVADDGGEHTYLLAALRRFAEPGSLGKGLRETVQQIAEDLHGFASVRRVILYIPGMECSNKDHWIRLGAASARPGIVFPEERMLSCARHGRVIGIDGGRELEWTDTMVCDAVCVTLFANGKPGFLYVEGEDQLAGRPLQAIQSAAEGVRLGLAIWRRAACSRMPNTALGGGAPLLVGRSKTLKDCMRMATRAAASEATVLLRGESGTGKELFARLIYSESMRRDGPFVPVHCSAIEDALMGSALFGHERGAFTGAVGLKRGLFEMADSGTIFLDEIGEMSQDAQVKLLRILQNGEFMRVGGVKPIQVDVRVVAATNRDLEVAVREGQFREDLYYRLRVIELYLPPLRERPEDIPDLVRHFMAEIGESLPNRVAGISDRAMQRLKRYTWPGNVRELRNIIERALVLVEGDEIGPEDIPLDEPDIMSGTETSSLGAMQQHHILQVLKESDGNKRRAAQRLGISRSTLYEKLKAVGTREGAGL